MPERWYMPWNLATLCLVYHPCYTKIQTDSYDYDNNDHQYYRFFVFHILAILHYFIVLISTKALPEQSAVMPGMRAPG